MIRPASKVDLKSAVEGEEVVLGIRAESVGVDDDADFEAVIKERFYDG